MISFSSCSVRCFVCVKLQSPGKYFTSVTTLFLLLSKSTVSPVYVGVSVCVVYTAIWWLLRKRCLCVCMLVVCMCISVDDDPVLSWHIAPSLLSAFTTWCVVMLFRLFATLLPTLVCTNRSPVRNRQEMVSTYLRARLLHSTLEEKWFLRCHRHRRCRRFWRLL